MQLKDLQNKFISNRVRVIASAYYNDPKAKTFIGKELEVRSIHPYDGTISVWNENKTASWRFNHSDVQYLTEVKYKENYLAIDDKVYVGGIWYTVYGHMFEDGDWGVFGLKEGGLLEEDCLDIYAIGITHHDMGLSTDFDKWLAEGKKQEWIKTGDVIK